MMRQIVKDIILCGDDAIRFANMLYRPTEDDLLHNKSIMEQIDHNITITETDNGYDAEIKDLDLDFLEEKPQYSLDDIKITWTLNIQKEELFYSSSNNEIQVQMIVETQKTSVYENITSDRMSLLAA